MRNKWGKDICDETVKFTSTLTGLNNDDLGCEYIEKMIDG